MKKTIISFLVIFLLMSANVFAVGDYDNFDPSPVVIEGQHVVSNNESLKTGRHTFVLTAKDNAPLPEKNKVTINSNEKFSFGEIEFQKQGTYVYSITRELTKSNELKEDDSVYTCTITVFADGSNVVVIEKDGVSGKPDKIIYSDEYIKKNEKVKTGDNRALFIYGGLFTAATLILLVRKRNDTK